MISENNKSPHIRKLSKTLLKHMGKEEASKEIQKYTELNENVNKVLQNLWDTAKVVGKFIALYVCIRKEEKSQIN